MKGTQDSKMKLCGKMIRKPGMPEARPCLWKINHRGSHTPDLTGLKNVFGFKEILKRGPDYVHSKSGFLHVRWHVLNNFETDCLVRASDLVNGNSKGINSLSKSGKGCLDKNGRLYAEYRTIVSHNRRVFNTRNPSHSSYKNMDFYIPWNPLKGGSFIEGCRWIRRNIPKPSSGHQLHVLKTKTHPRGFFGPGGIVWRHKMDRHDSDVLDLVSEWSNKKWQSFIKTESQRRNHAN